ncbi:hypothetical protein [Streptomyces sp. G1]|uniref:hypothetical protein n=1 Tax=Streptomyces sp. G1 TaxID=361572 RepID=UPI0020300666|nr:hypothetical protein [Streptomyces sp. G1]MCM1976330.1 hypothetical protein [Streptomyces sp. G1]
MSPARIAPRPARHTDPRPLPTAPHEPRCHRGHGQAVHDTARRTDPGQGLTDTARPAHGLPVLPAPPGTPGALAPPGTPGTPGTPGKEGRR